MRTPGMASAAALREPREPAGPARAAAGEWGEAACECGGDGGAGQGGAEAWPEGNCMLTDEYSPILGDS